MVGLVVDDLVVGVYRAAEDGTDEDGEEGQRRGHSEPAAQVAEDDGDAAELHVQDSVAEAGVERDEEADWREQELHGSDEKFAREFDDADVPFFEFCVEGPVSGFVAEAARFVDKKFWGVAFVDKDEVEKEDGALQDACKVLGPAPAKGRVGDESGRDDGAWVALT